MSRLGTQAALAFKAGAGVLGQGPRLRRLRALLLASSPPLCLRTPAASLLRGLLICCVSKRSGSFHFHRFLRDTLGTQAVLSVLGCQPDPSHGLESRFLSLGLSEVHSGGNVTPVMPKLASLTLGFSTCLTVRTCQPWAAFAAPLLARLRLHRCARRRDSLWVADDSSASGGGRCVCRPWADSVPLLSPCFPSRFI